MLEGASRENEKRQQESGLVDLGRRFAVFTIVSAGLVVAIRNAITLPKRDADQRIMRKAHLFLTQAAERSNGSSRETVDPDAVGFTQEVIEHLYTQALEKTESGLRHVREVKGDPFLSLTPQQYEAQVEMNFRDIITTWFDSNAAK